MPIIPVKGGFKYGKKGKIIYKTYEKALQVCKAIHAQLKRKGAKTK